MEKRNKIKRFYNGHPNYYRGIILNGIFIEFNKLGLYYQENNVRIDLNPNNVCEETKEIYLSYIFPKLENIKLTRIDVAFDITIDCSDSILLKSYAREMKEYKVCNDYKEPRMSLESKYIGSKNSKIRVKLYNKKNELASRGILTKEEHLWRLEVQLRGIYVNDWTDCLEGVSFNVLKLDGIKDDFERLALKQIVENNREWSSLTNYKKKKIKKSYLIRFTTTLIWQKF